MAEFDSSGFSAIDKFFGNETERATEEKKVSTTTGNRGKRRGGVGASTKSNDQGNKTLSSDLLAKQVLNVGRKRSRDDSNEDEFDGVDDHGVHDADDGDGGRTSIAQKKTTSSKNLSEKPSKPSKKLGRKERERQKQAAKAVGDETQENQSTSDAQTTETSKEEGGDTVNQKDSNQQKPKKKRRKVRSRQKNIRKDNRSADEKPAHLIPGSRNYKGRPMTQATREKLNLPAPTKKPFRSSWNNDKKSDDSLFVIDRNGNDDMGVKLAIDELMDDNGDAEKSASVNKVDDKPRKKDKKSSTRKRKRKFKNL